MEERICEKHEYKKYISGEISHRLADTAARYLSEQWNWNDRCIH